MLLYLCFILVLSYTVGEESYSYDAVAKLQRQGAGLCALIDSTNINVLRSSNDFVGWRCEYSHEYGGNLPIEDELVTVCGNYFYGCNDTQIATQGCTQRNISTQSWTGIDCDGYQSDEHFNNLTQIVTSLDLSSRSLTGTIPEEIGYLTGMRFLDLSSNSLTGTLSDDFLTRLLELHTFKVDYNSLTGTLPSSIGNISTMAVLGLRDNSFSGTIPASLRNLSMLHVVDLSNNLLTGSLPLDIFYLDGLQELTVSNNLLTHFPDVHRDLWTLQTLKVDNNLGNTAILGTDGIWGTHMRVLDTLWAHNNKFTASLPPTLGDLSELRDFQFYSNSITGSIPSTIGQLTRLSYFIGNDNSLTGTIPYQIGKCYNLMTFTVSSNSLTGTIPYNISDLRATLNILRLDHNLLTGTIHNEIFTGHTALQVIELQNNGITGTWPYSADLTALYYFDASYNTFSDQARITTDVLGLNNTVMEVFWCTSCNLHGTIPDEPDYVRGMAGSLSNLKRLYSLKLDSNSLTGTIPNSLTNCTYMQTLYLDSNLLIGTIPSALFQLAGLTTVSLHTNSLTGVIPDSTDPAIYIVYNYRGWGYISNRLQYVYMYSNSLTGTIPANLATSNTRMVQLDLSDNLLTGTLTTELFSSLTTYLNVLKINTNQLSGTLPSISSTTRLTTLDFGFNSLTGTIPNTWFDLTGLTYLDVKRNSLSNDYLNLMFAMDTLAHIDLSYNRFQATLPSHLGNASLTYLNLEANSFYGSIPTSGWRSTALSALRLGANSLTSSIPSILTTITSLTIFNAGQNSLTGTLPASLDSLSLLVDLSLPENSLSGTLPSEIGNIAALTNLNLNDNSWDGTLSLSLWTGLTNLQTLVLGCSSGTWDSGNKEDLNDQDWLFTLMRGGTLTSLTLQWLKITGTIPQRMINAATALKYLSLERNSLSGIFPSLSTGFDDDGYPNTGLSSLTALKHLNLARNSLSGIFPDSVCDIPSIEHIELFPKNTLLTCYPVCMDDNGLFNGSSSSSDVSACAPTSIPTSKPTSLPSPAPTGQPTGQPTAQPSYTYYDGKFVQTEEVAFNNITQDRNRSICIGELEIRSAAGYHHNASESLSSNLTEIWCVQHRNVDQFLFLSINDIVRENIFKNTHVSSTEYPTVDRLSLQSVVYRGKTNLTQVNTFSLYDNTTTYSSQAYSDGSAGSDSSGSSMTFGLEAVGDDSNSLWEDNIIDCPHFSSSAGVASYDAAKVLPISRSDAWVFGTSRMVTKIRLTDTPSVPWDSSSTTQASIQEEISDLFRAGTNTLVSAYLIQKGAVHGGRDYVKLQSASSDWNEKTINCSTQSLEYLYADDISSYTNIYSENITVGHNTLSWSKIDITDIARNQLAWWYLHHPDEAFELNLMWSALDSYLDTPFGRTHFYYNAAGDVLGDIDRTTNMTTGRTEWYTSESNDPPILIFYFGTKTV